MSQSIPQLFLVFSLCVFCACKEEAIRSQTEVYLAPGGGKYTIVSWTGILKAATLHPSAEVSFEKYQLLLPIAEHDERTTEGELALVTCRNGVLQHEPLGGINTLKKGEFAAHYLVQEGAAVSYRSPVMAYRVMMAQWPNNEWSLVLTNNQLSRRQAAKEMVGKGVKTLLDFGLTRKQGWYKYAQAPFEFRTGKSEAAAMMVFE